MATPSFGSSTWIFFSFFFFFWTKWRVVNATHEILRDLQSVESNFLVSDRYRTAYHFQPPKNWINDPNGPMLYKGVYHLFYQYNPNGAVPANIIWGHAVSYDMINWNILKPAIYRNKPYDIDGCYSGSTTILPGNRPAILYTSVAPSNIQTQSIAFPKNYSDPYLIDWVKPIYNPLIPVTPGINASFFRDPTTAWRGRDGYWRVVVGSKCGGTGQALLYHSGDFVHWTKAMRPLHQSQGTGMWECPDFYPVLVEGRRGLDTSINSGYIKHVLKVSLDVTRYEYYTIGRYIERVDHYVPDPIFPDNRYGLRYDYGNFYASKTFYDYATQRRILLAWANESDTTADDIAKGWAGIHTIPRVVWLDNNERQLIQWPIEELESLRGKKVSLRNVELKKSDVFEVKGIKSSQADVELEFEVPNLEKAEIFHPEWLLDPKKVCTQKGPSVPGGVGPFGLLVLASKNLQEFTAVFFRIFKYSYTDKYVTLMCSDASRSSINPELYKPSFGGFVDVDMQKEFGKISLRSLIDHSVVESFAARGKTCITSRVYPYFLSTNAEAKLFAFNNGYQTVRITKLNAWEMESANIFS